MLAVGQDDSDAVVGQGILWVAHSVPFVGLTVPSEVFDVEQSVGSSHPEPLLGIANDAEKLVACPFACNGRQRVGSLCQPFCCHRDATVCTHPDVGLAVGKKTPHCIACQRLLHAGIVQQMVHLSVFAHDEKSVVGTHQQVALLVATQ